MSVTPTVIRVTDDDNRASIGEAIGHLNTHAKMLSRRGKVGTLSADYKATHERINALLADYLAAAP